MVSYLSCTRQSPSFYVCSHVYLEPLEVIELSENLYDVMILSDHDSAGYVSYYTRRQKAFNMNMAGMKVNYVSSASSNTFDDDPEVVSSDKTYGDNLRDLMAHRYYRC